MNFDSFFASIGIKAPHACFKETLREAYIEYKKNGVFFLEHEYIQHVNTYEKCLSHCLEQTKCAAAKLRSQVSLAIYALFLYRAMEQRTLFLEHLDSFEFPNGDADEQRLLPFLVLLPVIPSLYAKLKKRNVPDDIISATLRQFEDCVYLTQERTGRFGFFKRYFDHMQLYVDEKVLNIGRLRFEMVEKYESNVLILKKNNHDVAVLFDGATINNCGMLWGTPPLNSDQSPITAVVNETDATFQGFCSGKAGNCKPHVQEYPKNTWKPALKKGDAVLSLHIPNKGALSKEACEESYRRAQAVFKACYPEFEFKAFHCHSWMLDPQLQRFLPNHSNILAFQRQFTVYAGQTEGQDVFNFVFKLKFNEYQDMPEDTSLQRALKQHYLAGNYIYEYEGIFFTDEENENCR